MKRLAYTLLLMLTSLLVSCAQWGDTQTTSVEMISPGDQIGEMTVGQGTETDPYPLIWDFCEFPTEKPEPGTFTTACRVPLSTSTLKLSVGWFAEESKLESNWEMLTWEWVLDGYPVDLDAFEWEEKTVQGMGPGVKKRIWTLILENVSPGEHSFYWSWTAEETFDDGFTTYSPGTYEFEVSYTVAGPEVLPELSAGIKTGVGRCTSEAAGLNYILETPGDFGTDPQDK